MRIESETIKLREYDKEKDYAFVSYSKQDAGRVYPIIRKLQDKGYNIWIDTKGLAGTAGESWVTNMTDTINNVHCKCVLFFVSLDSMLSVPVYCELKHSHSREANHNKPERIKVIPICVDKDWSPRKKGVEKWMKEDLGIAGNKHIKPEEYELLRKCREDKEHLSSVYSSFWGLYSHIAQAIYDVNFAPYGGNEETFVMEDSTESIIQNIPKSVRNCSAVEDDINNHEKTRRSAAQAQSDDIRLKQSGNDEWIVPVDELEIPRNPVVEIELGDKIVNYYSSLFGKLTNTGDLLVPRTKELRDELNKQGIILPQVRYVSNSASNKFVVKWGVEKQEYLFDAKRMTPYTVLERLANAYRIPELTRLGLENQIEAGIEYTKAKDYEQAMNCFSKAVYWCSMMDENVSDIYVNGLIDLCYVCVTNKGKEDDVRHDIETANVCADVLLSLLDGKENYSSFAGFNIDFLCANIKWLTGDCEKAIQLYNAAAKEARRSSDVHLQIAVLWSIVCACSYSHSTNSEVFKDAIKDLRGILNTNPQKYAFAKQYFSMIHGYQNETSPSQLEWLGNKNQIIQKEIMSIDDYNSPICGGEINGVLMFFTLNTLCKDKIAYRTDLFRLTRDVGELIVGKNG